MSTLPTAQSRSRYGAHSQLNMTTHGPMMGGEKLRFYTVPELARLLRIAEKTVYRYVNTGEISFVALRRGLRFSVDDVETFIATHRMPCTNEYGSTKNGSKLAR